MAMFNIRAKDTQWYIARHGSLARMNQLTDEQFLEQCESINSLLGQLSFDIDNCIEWAQNLWLRIFISNVQAANVQLKSQKSKQLRCPASKATFKLNANFISAATQLLAKVIGIQVENAAISSIESKISNFLGKNDSYEAREIPVYRKRAFFKQLAFIKMPPLVDNMKHPNELQEFAVHPIDPTNTNPLAKKFIIAAATLRSYNFKGVVESTEISITAMQHGFLWGSRFENII